MYVSDNIFNKDFCLKFTQIKIKITSKQNIIKKWILYILYIRTYTLTSFHSFTPNEWLSRPTPHFFHHFQYLQTHTPHTSTLSNRNRIRLKTDFRPHSSRKSDSTIPHRRTGSYTDITHSTRYFRSINYAIIKMTGTAHRPRVWNVR